MLINLNKWRENNIEQYFIEYAAKYGEFLCMEIKMLLILAYLRI